MKITDAKVIVCCPGRNFVTLKIFTDQGIYGLGDGFLTIDDSPGIGVDIDEKSALRFPYTMARLPVNRKTDGTMFNW